MTILIIEDERLAAFQLQSMIREYDPTISVLGPLDSVEASIAWFQTHTPPDLLLADIELVDGQSFEIFNQVDVRCPIIFTTAYDEYALRAFRVNSVDYLLKPIDEAALRQSLVKFQELRKLYGAGGSGISLRELVAALHQTTVPETEYRERFLLKQGSRLVPIEARDIAYFFTRDRLTFVRTWDNRAMNIDFTLDELEHLLNPKQFFRANRQIIVCPQSVEKVHLHFNSRLKLELKPAHDEETFISRDKAAEFRTWMGE